VVSKRVVYHYTEVVNSRNPVNDSSMNYMKTINDMCHYNPLDIIDINSVM